MKRKIWKAIGTVLILIIGILLFFKLFIFSVSLPNPKDIEHENIEIEEKLKEILIEVIEEQKQKGIEISIEYIETYTPYAGNVKLTCKGLEDFDKEREIIETINNKLVERYPKIYDSFYFDVSFCSTKWRLERGEYGHIECGEC